MNDIINLLEKVKTVLALISIEGTDTPEDDAAWAFWDVEDALNKLREIQRNQ